MINNVQIEKRKLTFPSICGVDEILYLISNEMEHSTVILSSDFVFYLKPNIQKKKYCKYMLIQFT